MVNSLSLARKRSLRKCAFVGWRRVALRAPFPATIQVGVRVGRPLLPVKAWGGLLVPDVLRSLLDRARLNYSGACPTLALIFQS